jgi:sugar/nucleoside kinase (ribokinase family)
VRVLALGEALVDLVRERDGRAGVWVEHPGGAVANVAALAARLGADVALAGGAGDDAWGAWLRAGLAADGVVLDWFWLVPDARTPVAFVTVDDAGEPEYLVYGEAAATPVAGLGERILDAVDSCEALFVSSNTLVDDDERELTHAARARALEREQPVVVDPNLRPARWVSAARAAAATRELLPGAFLVRCNGAEAAALTGEVDAAAAAESLVAAGAQHAVVTRGADGAVLRGGGLRLDVPGAAARVLDTSGAGDAFTAVLLTRLAASRFYPATLAAALPEAVEQAARACERFGAR